MEIKETNFIQIYVWMNTQLHLKGNDEKVFAFLHGFIKGIEKQAYTGSAEYIYKTLGISKNACLSSLKNLMDMGIIYRIESSRKEKGFIKTYDYYENINLLPNAAKYTSPKNGLDETTGAKNGLGTGAEIGHDTGAKNGLDNDFTGAKNGLHNIEYIDNIEDNKIDVDNIDKQHVLKNDIDAILLIFEKCKHPIDKSNKPQIEYIKKRLKEGYTKEQLSIIIIKKYCEWVGKDCEEFIKPSTLFGQKHFKSYFLDPISERVLSNIKFMFNLRLDKNGNILPQEEEKQQVFEIPF